MKPKHFLIGPSAFVLAAGFLQAATMTIQLTGVVASVAEVSVAPSALATAIPLEEGAVNEKIAVVNEKCNDLLGYTVTLSSANAVEQGSATPVMTRNGGGGESAVYTLTYGGAPVVFISGSALVTPAGVLTTSSGVNKDLNITLPGGQIFTAGQYTDTLTFNLTVN